MQANPCPNAMENGGDGFHSAWDCPAGCTYMPKNHPGKLDKLEVKDMRRRVETYPYPEDCEECDGKKPCEAHKHLAERDC